MSAAGDFLKFRMLFDMKNTYFFLIVSAFMFPSDIFCPHPTQLPPPKAVPYFSEAVPYFDPARPGKPGTVKKNYGIKGVKKLV